MFGACVERFDERQLWVRGNVFQRAFLLLVVLIFVDAFLRDFGFIWAPGQYPGLLIILFTVEIEQIEMIARDVYTVSRRRQAAIVGGIFLVTIIGFARSLFELIAEGEQMLDGVGLSEFGAIFCMLGIMSIGCGISLVLTLLQKRRESGGE